MKRKLKELMNRALRKEEGFTLVEIIVVIVIMAILAAIAVPSVLSYINDANEAKYIAEARAIYLAIQVEETKENAMIKGDDVDPIYVNSSATDGAAKDVFDAVVKRIGNDSSELTVKTATYASGVYSITFTSADKSNQSAKIDENNEVDITTNDAS